MTLTADPTLSPKSFPLVEIGDLVEFRRGLTYKKSDEVESSNTGVLRANNVDLVTGQLDLSDIRYLTDKVEVPQARKLATDSLLICTASGSRAHLGKMAHITNAPDLAFGGFMGLLVPKPEVSARYIWYFSRSEAYRDYLDSLAPGANINNLRFDDLAGLVLPLPPLDEQKRIVAKLDQAFAALDRARANAEANRSGADEVYRLAIAAILESEGSKGFSTYLGDISKIRAGAGFPEAEQGKLEGAYPFYKVSDMNRAGNEEYLTAANNYISDAVQKRLGAFVFPAGTIVFPKVGGAIATNKKRVLCMESCVDNNIMGLIPDVDKVSPDFLHELMRATDIYEFSNKANPPSITQATVSEWPVQIPLRGQQDRVVGQIKRLRGGIDSLKAHYDMQLTNISALRQSLLQAAFSGQLS